MSLSLKSLVILLSAGMLVACGFHLRGSVELSPEITPVFLDKSGADSALNRELRTLLLQSGKDVLTQTKSEAKTVLNIVSAREKKRVVAVDDRGRARQYDLSYLLRYSLAGKNIPQSGSDNISELHLKRSLTFDPDNVLAIGHEAERLYNDMRKDSARLIMQRMQALGDQVTGKASTEQ
jgi:LPS-assembly lipoprotein